MQELKKILEEIELEKQRSSLSRDCSNEYAVTEILLLEKIEKIIRKHLSRENDPETARSSRDNDGWIPVEERMPEDGETVLCTDGQGVYLAEYDADWDAPFGDIDKIIAWRPLPEPYQPKSN